MHRTKKLTVTDDGTPKEISAGRSIHSLPTINWRDILKVRGLLLHICPHRVPSEVRMNSLLRRNLVSLLAIAVAITCVAHVASADTFTYVDRSGKQIEIEAKLAGSGQKFHAMELSDGQLLLVPQAAVMKRVPGDDPTPLDAAAVEKKLYDIFRKERLLTLVEKSMVVAFIHAQPVEDPKQLRKKKLFLKKTAKFLRSVQGKFLSFIRLTRVKAQPLKYPIVAVIFESNSDFEQYAKRVTGNRGLSAGAIAGFYDSLSNQLVLRVRECKTFEVPLHEAIHQQVYNRRILQRLAPIPVWFNEGIATGFEGNGERISNSPTSISSRYSKLSLRARTIGWNEIVESDKPFQGDVLAGEAYGHAWGLHWLLLTRHKAKYAKYVRLLASKKTLAVETPDERRKQFEDIFKTNANMLQRQFVGEMARVLRRKVSSSVPLDSTSPHSSPSQNPLAGPVVPTTLGSLRNDHSRADGLFQAAGKLDWNADLSLPLEWRSGRFENR